MEPEKLTITFMKPNRNFLQIYGHKKPQNLFEIKQQIAAYYPHVEHKARLHSPVIEFDTIYLVLNKNTNEYHRCTVIEKRPRKAIIRLIDYGNEVEVDNECVSHKYK